MKSHKITTFAMKSPLNHIKSPLYHHDVCVYVYVYIYMVTATQEGPPRSGSVIAERASRSEQGESQCILVLKATPWIWVWMGFYGDLMGI